MKKLICLFITCLLCFAPLACARNSQPQVAETVNYRVAIITPCKEDNAELYFASKRMMQRHVSNVTAYTLPLGYSQADVQNSIKLVSEDEEVRTIIIAPAASGACNGMNDVKAQRQDILFICVPEKGNEIKVSESADITICVDRAGMGAQIADKAKEMGAMTLIHYSFMRELNDAAVKMCREDMLARCESIGISFLDVTMPTPTGDADSDAEVEAFLKADVTRQVDMYGTNTAFYCTNDESQRWLIKAVLDTGAIYPQQSEPGPFTGYIDALGIDMTEHEGDVNYAFAAINSRLCDMVRADRMSTWRTAPNALFIEIAAEYGVLFNTNQTIGKRDEDVLLPLIEKTAGVISASGTSAGEKIANSEDTGSGEAPKLDRGEAYAVTKLMDGKVRVGNCYMLRLGYYIFGE